MKFKLRNQTTKGYITLVVIILLVPFLLLQGINLVNTSIDIVHISSSSISRNRQHINEQTCWEEILYYFKNNGDILGQKIITTSEIHCVFLVEEIDIDKYKISLNSQKDNFHSFSQRYVLYDNNNLDFIVLE
jgi:hypothetical protein